MDRPQGCSRCASGGRLRRRMVLDGQLLGGRYRVSGLLGEGAASIVYCAESQLFGQVAVKVLREAVRAEAQAVARFMAEAHATSAINHPNVVRVLDVGSHDELPFLVMELCEGDTLRSIVDQRGALGVSYACELCQQVLDGLSAAHAIGIVHRDLTPANVVVSHPTPERPLAKVLDFGVAKRMLGASSRDDAVFGTPGYMAPEQVQLGRVDHRADVYAVGAVLYELLTGRTPFRGDSAAEVMNQIVSRPPMPLMAFDRSLSRELDALVRTCLAKNPIDRPASARELRDRLAPFVTKLSIPAAGSMHPLSQEPVPLVAKRGPETQAVPLVMRPRNDANPRPRLELLTDSIVDDDELS